VRSLRPTASVASDRFVSQIDSYGRYSLHTAYMRRVAAGETRDTPVINLDVDCSVNDSLTRHQRVSGGLCLNAASCDCCLHASSIRRKHFVSSRRPSLKNLRTQNFYWIPPANGSNIGVVFRLLSKFY